MADPISITAGTLSIISNVLKLQHKIKKLANFSKESPEQDELADLLIILDVYTGLFAETVKVSSHLAISNGDLSVQLIQLCHKRLIRLRTILDKYASGTHQDEQDLMKSLRDAVDRYGQAVDLLRNAEMGQSVLTLKDIIREQADTLQSFSSNMMRSLDAMSAAPDRIRKEDIDELKTLMEDIQPSTHIRTGGNAHVGDQYYYITQVNHAEETTNLSAAAPEGHSLRTKPRVAVNDDFQFTATIIKPGESQNDHQAVRGSWDTGSPANWVTHDIVERSGLVHTIQPIDEEEEYYAFGGGRVVPRGVVDLTWFTMNGAKSRQTRFLVIERAPFDMILGRRFITEEEAMLFNPAVLHLFNDISQEDRRKAQEKAIADRASEEELIRLRRADEAAQRAARRQARMLQQSMLAIPAIPASHSTAASTLAITNGDIQQDATMTLTRSASRDVSSVSTQISTPGSSTQAAYNSTSFTQTSSGTPGVGFSAQPDPYTHASILEQGSSSDRITELS